MPKNVTDETSSRQYQRSAQVYCVRPSLVALSHVSSELQEGMRIRNSHQSSFCPVTTAKMPILFLLHTYLYIHIHVWVSIHTYFCRYMQDKSEHHTVGLLCKGNTQKTKLVTDLKTQEIEKYHSHSLSPSLCALKLK